jgi:hypothetical protein
MLSSKDIQKYVFILVISILFIISFNKSNIISPLFNSRTSFHKKMSQVGGNLKDSMNMVVLTALSIFAIVSMYKYINLTSIIFIFASIVLIFSLTDNLLFSVALSLILGSVIISFTNTSTSKEYFENKDIVDKKKNEDTNKIDNETDSEITNDDENDEKIKFDHKASFLENYKSLSKEQVDGLNKDTIELMETQKKLIETLKNMGPVLKDGKNVLDTFKTYFGDDNADMINILKKVKDNKL